MAAEYDLLMLYQFMTTHRPELISRCREKAALRFSPGQAPAETNHGVPLFLKQVVDILHEEQGTVMRATVATEPTPAPTAIGRAAALHGVEMLKLGFSIDQVVHGYGDVCQSVTEMAVEEKKVISADEFRTLNRCLDDAIADAVTSFGQNRQHQANEHAETLHQRLNSFADEHLRLVEIAIHAYAAIQTGNIGLSGATGTLLVHALQDLRSLAVRALPDIRLASAQTTVTVP